MALPTAAMPLDFEVEFNRPQDTALEALAPGNTLFLGWGRGVGKSKFLRLIWWLLIAQYEHVRRSNAPAPFYGVRILVLMPTLKQFKDVHWGGIVDELTGEFAFLGAHLDRQSGQITFPNGSFVKPFPASEYNARTARGLRCDVLVIDECDSVSAGVYDAVAQPWLSEPWSLGIRIIAGTPQMGRHGLWWRTLQQGEDGARLRQGLAPLATADVASHESLRRIFAFRATYRDSPETVSAAAAEMARATMPPATFAREWLADPDAGEGVIYPFDATFHVREPPKVNTFREFHVGMDHGWVDPGVLLLLGIQGHGEDATAWVLDEHYESECPNHIWDARAKAWSFAKFWADPSRPDRIADLRRMQLQVGESDNTLLGGIARVADLLFVRRPENATPFSRLYVAPKCRNTIREFGLYRRKKTLAGAFGEAPEDKHNHAMDALRYAVVGRFGLGGSNVRHLASK